MITFKNNASFSKTLKYFNAISKALNSGIFDKYGQMGVEALSNATPKDTGKTSESWSYRIIKSINNISIQWDNSNENDGVNIAVIIQYGHGTKNGVYIQGIDYINPAMKPIFDGLFKEIWEDVKT